MITHFPIMLVSALSTVDPAPSLQGTDWLCLLLPTAGVALVSGIFNCIDSRRMKRLEAKLASRTGFFMHKLEAHEKLWPLVAECNRAQQALSYRRGKGEDLTPFTEKIKESRKQMKNFVYDNGLYFDQRIRGLTQELDSQLGDKNIGDVHEKVEELESELRRIVNEMA